jgi:hypothetical protein
MQRSELLNCAGVFVLFEFVEAERLECWAESTMKVTPARQSAVQKMSDANVSRIIFFIKLLL